MKKTIPMDKIRSWAIVDKATGEVCRRDYGDEVFRPAMWLTKKLALKQLTYHRDAQVVRIRVLPFVDFTVTSEAIDG